MKIEIKHIENGFANASRHYLDWQNAYKRVVESNHQENEFVFDIELSGAAANALELCYAFPLVDYLLQQGKRAVINIKTSAAAGSPSAKSGQARVRALLLAQACKYYANTRMSILLDGKALAPMKALFAGTALSEKQVYPHLDDDTKELLRGALLVSERKSSNGVEKRTILVSRALSDNTLAKLKETIEKLTKEEFNTTYDVSFERIPEISRIAPILSVSAVREDESIFLDDLICPITIRRRPHFQLNYLFNACYLLRSYLEDWRHFKAQKPYKMSDVKKKELANQLKKVMDEKLSAMNLLNTIIWLYILRDLQESKELIKLACDINGEENWYLNLELLEKSHINAVSYAEGLYQLIENACLHAHGKRAYWGMRMYRTKLTGASDATVNRALTVHALHEQYRLCASIKTEPDKSEKGGEPGNCIAEKADENSKLRLSPSNIFNSGYTHLLEFYVIDEAINGNGILRTSAQEFGSIEELIEDSPSVTDMSDGWDKFSDNVANHYGLRVFCKIIEGNEGYIIARSPGWSKQMARPTDTLFRRRGFNIHDSETEAIRSYTTSFHILAPLLPEWKFSEKGSNQQSEMFVEDIPETPYKTTCVKVCSSAAHTGDKVEYVKKLVERLNAAMEALSPKVVLTIDMRESGMYEAELLAKALFKLCIQRGVEEKSTAFYVAVLFPENSNEPYEFTRIFAAFYDKMADSKTIVGEEQRIRGILGKMQIAVCTVKTQSSEICQGVEVNFIISGEDPALAFQSVKNYLYKNFSSGIRFVPLLRYLAYGKSISGRKKAAVNWFPFDIYLSKQSFDGEKTQICNPWIDCLFLDRMNHILHTDLQEHADGCRIAGVHMRLGSKLHLDTFYEAELLLRSIGNVQSFACIIANELLKGLTGYANSEKRIILVGYEKYSAELVTQIYGCMKEEGWAATACVIPAAGSQQNCCVQLSSCEGSTRQSRNESKQEALLYTVVPVGSTMSTVYKVRSIAKRHYEKYYKIAEYNTDTNTVRDFCLVAVNRQLKDSDQEDRDNITWRFWESADSSKKIIRVKQERNTVPALTVQYLLNADAKWSEPIGSGGSGDCEACKDLLCFDVSKTRQSKLPLLQVDKTSLIPATIFRLKDSRLQLMNSKDEKNKERMEKLRGLIRYGHVCENDNHYQFYFDLGKLFQINEKDVKKWIASIKVDDPAYNIIIAPNNIDAAPFLCAVMEQVFGNSLRFLHLDINNAYREDVRLKFSQVAEEYKYLRRDMPNVPFRVYYIADTIASTRTISRAQLLVNMLLNESGLNEIPRTFAKVILLLCRSSFDTMKQFVERPQEDVIAWLTLSIPPYNMQADRCPACELLDKYALLRKRSATKTISAMFERLEQKHAKRSCEEYDRWLLEDICQSHSYYAWFKQWFYLHDNETSTRAKAVGMTQDQVDGMKLAFKRELMKVLSRLPFPKGKKPSDLNEHLRILSSGSEAEDDKRRDQFRKLMSDRKLANLADSYQEANPHLEKLPVYRIAEMVRDTVVAARNYRRLICLQEAYESLILIQTEASTVEEMNQELDRKTRAKILHLISNHLSPQPHSRAEYAENAEWLISFIKVLSRDLLVKYYPIHRAMVNLMYDMLAYINYGDAAVALTEVLVNEDPNWDPVVRTLRFNPYGSENCIRSSETALCASLQYEIFMTLVHRLSVLQCSLVYEKEAIGRAIDGLTKISEKHFGIGSYRVKQDELLEMLTFTELPPAEDIRNRYIKSVKTATMLTSNDDPCYRMAREMRGEHP